MRVGSARQRNQSAYVSACVLVRYIVNRRYTIKLLCASFCTRPARITTRVSTTDPVSVVLRHRDRSSRDREEAAKLGQDVAGPLTASRAVGDGGMPLWFDTSRERHAALEEANVSFGETNTRPGAQKRSSAWRYCQADAVRTRPALWQPLSGHRSYRLSGHSCMVVLGCRCSRGRFLRFLLGRQPLRARSARR
jgi:hypothetical protein